MSVGVTAPATWPGADQLEAQTVALGELSSPPDGVRVVPPLVHVPGRGPWASPLARAAALLSGMHSEAGPHGWRLADRPGRDLERARSALHEELDAWAVAAHGWTGPVCVTVPGPWTLAATLYLARGDRVLSDRGAVRDLTEALVDGTTALLRSVLSGVPGAEPVVVLREPRLHDVLRGAVPTFSGHGRLRSVRTEDATSALRGAVEQLRSAGAHAVVLQVGDRYETDAVTVLASASPDALGVPVDRLGSSRWEQLAALVEAGTALWLGWPASDGGEPVDSRALAESVAQPWRAVGLPAGRLADVVVHCSSRVATGGPGASLAAARADCARAVEAAARLAEIADGG